MEAYLDKLVKRLDDKVPLIFEVLYRLQVGLALLKVPLNELLLVNAGRVSPLSLSEMHDDYVDSISEIHRADGGTADAPRFMMDMYRSYVILSFFFAGAD